MKIATRLAAACAFLALAGCNTFHIGPFLDEEITGSDYNTCLAEAYQKRAKAEVKVDHDWLHASRFAPKGYAALRGEPVEPWVASDWNINPADQAEFDTARSRLMSAVAAKKDTNPCACAKSVALYDGWLEQANDNDLGKGFKGPTQPDYVAAERAMFYKSLAECEGVVASKDFTIYFGFDKFNLTAEAMAVIDEIAAMVTSMGQPAVTVSGYTDTSGSVGYNARLSERRAGAVAGALSQRGVNTVSTEAFGETNLAVPTADGVREPLNRRATVTIGN